MTTEPKNELPETIYAETKGTNRIWRPFYEQADVPHDGVGEYRLVSIGTRALTPESEGIAGKVDLTYDQIDRLIDIHLGKEDMHELDRGNLQSFVNKVLEAATLARPQEINVEQIRWDTVKSVSDARHNPLSIDAGSAISEAIDHLASSGRLK